jgi:hypothetical protein
MNEKKKQESLEKCPVLDFLPMQGRPEHQEAAACEKEVNEGFANTAWATIEFRKHTRDDNHVGAFPGEAHGYGFAYATPRAGHQGDFSDEAAIL